MGLVRASNGEQIPAIESKVEIFEDTFVAEGGVDESPVIESNVVVYRHRVDHTDLSPGTRYEITFAGAETGLYVETAPATLEEPITFAQGGDIGVNHLVPKLHQQAASWDPLFALLGGDLAYREPGKCAEGCPKWKRFLEQWHDHMRSGNRLIPMVAAIGNHETNDRGEATYYFSLYGNTRREQAHWTFSAGDYLTAILLDSELPATGESIAERIGGAQKDWLESRLQQHQGVPHLFAAYHTPAYTSHKSRKQERSRLIRQHWHPLFEAYGIDAAFEHDGHMYSRTWPLCGGKRNSRGILYLGDGAWGQWEGDRTIVGDYAGKGADPGERMTAEEIRKALGKLEVVEATNFVLGVTIFPDGHQEFRAVDHEGNVVDQFRGIDDPQDCTGGPFPPFKEKL